MYADIPFLIFTVGGGTAPLPLHPTTHRKIKPQLDQKSKVDQREINILNCKSVKGGYQFCLNFLPYSLSHSFLKSHEKSYKKSLTRYVLFPKIRKELKKMKEI